MATAPTPAPVSTDNSFSRIFGVLFAPKQTFESIVRRPTWVVPVIFGCIAFIAVVAVFTQRGGWPSFFEKQDANNSRMQKMSAEDRERTMNAQLKFRAYFRLHRRRGHSSDSCHHRCLSSHARLQPERRHES